MGKDSFSQISKPVLLINYVVCMNTCLRALERFGCEHYLDPGEGKIDFQQKW